MDFEKKLTELAKYGISFETYNGEYYHISVEFPEGWEILLPDNEYIHLENRGGVSHYVGSIKDIKIDDIFKAIDLTVSYNKDLEMKLELFKEKTDELQKLFSTEKYEVLKTLEFKVKRLKEKKKITKKEEETNKEEEKE